MAIGDIVPSIVVLTTVLTTVLMGIGLGCTIGIDLGDMAGIVLIGMATMLGRGSGMASISKDREEEREAKRRGVEAPAIVASAPKTSIR
jgi:predicted Zn-dependent protease